MRSGALAAEDEALIADKHSLRAAMRQRRDGIPASDQQRAATSAAFHLSRFLEGRALSMVALYASIHTELDSSPLARALEARGIATCFPLVQRHRRVLEFRAAPLAELVPGCLGIPEPTDNHPIVDLRTIDCFVIPGLAFDRTGTRLGWGGGYYDQTLIHNPSASRIGLCYAVQVVSSLPQGPQDVPMTALATEEGVVACKRP